MEARERTADGGETSRQCSVPTPIVTSPPHPQSSAVQAAGRCGRTRAGDAGARARARAAPFPTPSAAAARRQTYMWARRPARRTARRNPLPGRGARGEGAGQGHRGASCTGGGDAPARPRLVSAGSVRGAHGNWRLAAQWVWRAGAHSDRVTPRGGGVRACARGGDGTRDAGGGIYRVLVERGEWGRSFDRRGLPKWELAPVIKMRSPSMTQAGLA